MKVDTILPAADWAALPDEARRLEEAGYDAAWAAEVSHDPFLPLGRYRRAAGDVLQGLRARRRPHHAAVRGRRARPAAAARS